MPHCQPFKIRLIFSLFATDRHHRHQGSVGIMSDPKTNLLLQVRGQDPLEPSAPTPTYSNFLAVARLGTDVQFEFVFLDLNQLASFAEDVRKGAAPSAAEFRGKTVAKIVMPGQSVIHMKEHFEKILKALEEALQEQEAPVK
jgi:hypothetical protein